jgi:tRNA threonylcarbamoyl adenosine modification protein YeaZ
VLVLGFDTATPAVTVALADRTGVLFASTVVDSRRHAELLAPAIAAGLAAVGARVRDVDRIVVGVGPGPFTGLRVGVVTARTLGAVLDIPVRGVGTLDILAFGSGLSGPFRVATDARRRSVYWASYDGPRRTGGPYVAPPAEAAWQGPVVGAGARRYPDAFPDAREPEHPSAAALCEYLLAGLPTVEAVPRYLRPPDVSPPTPRKPVLR